MRPRHRDDIDHATSCPDAAVAPRNHAGLGSAQEQLSRRTALGLLATGAMLTTGCPLSMPESLPRANSSADPDGIPLSTLIAQTLETEKRTRGLSTMVNGAWQIFHGILAYGAEFEIDTPEGRLPALDYFAAGGTCNGYRPLMGDRLGAEGRPGLRVDLEPSTKAGQGHRDQWLAVVSQANLPLETPWIADGRTYQIEDWLRQAEHDVPLNYEYEFSWTLIPLTNYRPTDYSWVARDGEPYSTELLLESEVLRDLSASVCGGTHRLIGIAMAVRKRLQEGIALSGIWAQAQDHLTAAIELARVNQNPDGSYSTSYLHRTGWCNDLGESLGTTGHVLEFLAVTADQQTLQADWVQRSVRKLCQVLEQCRGVDLECGVLYHALHGLVEYQRRTQTAPS